MIVKTQFSLNIHIDLKYVNKLFKEDIMLSKQKKVRLL